MKITELGEFGLIERIKKSFKTGKTVVKGVGDDCAVLEFDKSRYQLFTCDMLVEGVDFTARQKPYLIGRKSLAVSLSDIAACAGIPRYAVISLGIPEKTTVSYLDKFIQGLKDIAREFKVDIVGGDISRSGRLTVDLSLLGLVEKKRLVLRCGAKPGDIIFVSGTLGGSINGRHLKFRPRINEARYLAENFKINSMIDISDGLAQDLGHILKESRAGAVVYSRLIPQDKSCRGIEDALYSGEDFELLFSLSPKEAGRLLNKKSRIFSPIGYITAQSEKLVLVCRGGREEVIKPHGYCHF
ncbi:MAG: thiamine-phosphate kinase [Candidatus Omnitrophota bacterium]